MKMPSSQSGSDLPLDFAETPSFNLLLAYCYKEPMKEEDRSAIEKWVAQSPDHQEFITFCSDIKNLSRIFKKMLIEKYDGPGKPPPPNEIIEILNEYSGGKETPFYFQ